MHTLHEEFRENGIVRGGILFLSAADAIELINHAESQGVKVLGIDAFRLGAQSTEPVLEHSVDLSRSLESGKSSWAAARQHISNRMAEGLMFEVVLE